MFDPVVIKWKATGRPLVFIPDVADARESPEASDPSSLAVHFQMSDHYPVINRQCA
ncbi:UNVERIFIED_CONTAM: hypothetical protein K2H54_059889, partial [Gekko kuhli]